MGDCSQRFENLNQAARAHEQRVAARQQHVRDFRMIGDVTQALRNIVGYLVVVVHEQPLAKTVTAVRAAHLVAQQKHRVCVFVLDAARNRDRLLVAGVKLAPVIELLFARDD